MSMQCKTSTNGIRKAFTLIELLVVISIIALLMAIMMPALGKAKEAAKRVICGSNQKQLAEAVYTYSTENGQLPWYGLVHDPSNGHIGDKEMWLKIAESYWYNVIAEYMSSDIELDFDKKISDKTAKVRTCPSSRKGDPDPLANFSGPGKGLRRTCYVGVNYGGYPGAPFEYHYSGSLSSYVSGNSVAHSPVRISKIKNPTEWIMLMDTQTGLCYSPGTCESWNLTIDADGDGEYDSGNGIINTNRLAYNGAHPFLHSKGMNIALCDGHVEYMKAKKIWKWDKEHRRMAHRYWNQ